VRGAGVARSGERTTATLSQVEALAEAVPPRYRMLILLAAWSGARWGELVVLSRDRLDIERGTMRIDRQYVELEDNSLVLDTPKTAAGIRTVHIPPHLLPDLQAHLEDHANHPMLVFTTGLGGPLSRGGFRSTWVKARERAGLPEFRLLSRPGARCRHCCRSVSPGRSPNPPCQFPGNGLSTVSAVRRGSRVAMGLGSCFPGRRSG